MAFALNNKIEAALQSGVINYKAVHNGSGSGEKT